MPTRKYCEMIIFDWLYEVGYFVVPVLSNEPEFKIDMKWIDIFKFEDFY